MKRWNCGWPGWVAMAALLAAAVGPARAADPRWSVQISTAPTNPQDIWVTGHGNNGVGWQGGGVICLGVLAQGFSPTEHATLKADIVEGGILGIDGTPVAPGTYVAPSQELGDRTFDVVQGQTFYVILATQVVNSSIPFIPVGTRSRLMLTFEHLPGRNSQLVVAWMNTPAGWVPFLNEGVMMTNIRQQR
jgi:hypothetical protein